MLKHLIRILAPEKCISCGVVGPVVCDDCLTKIALTKSSTCFLCNAQTNDFSTCTRCRRKSSLSRVYVASYYDQHVKQLITRLKYHNAVDAAEPLSRLLLPIVPNKYDLVVPVPSSSRRFKQRGYSPAALLAKKLAKSLGAEYVELLGRLGHSRQVGANRMLRLKQLKGQFYLLRPAVEGRVLLVDDVVTTGTTLNECAAVLKDAKFKKIDAAVVARH